jgi:hypothetical protein
MLFLFGHKVPKELKKLTHLKRAGTACCGFADAVLANVLVDSLFGSVHWRERRQKGRVSAVDEQ